MFEPIYPDSKDRSYEISFKFYLPDNDYDLKVFQNAHKAQEALSEIRQLCRRVWKYDDKATEDMVKLAQEIGQIAAEGEVEE